MDTPTTTPRDTAREFLTSRLQGWGEIAVIPQERGGFDIVLRVDGSYSTRADAEEMAEWFRRQVLELLGTAPDRGSSEC